MADPLPWPDLDPIPPGWLGDTPHEAIRVMRALTPSARAAAAHALWRSARHALAASERMRDPGADAPAVEARVRGRLGDRATSRR